jgi:ADP-ribosylglycohydrolase/beta-phosphoglucomutase-like phosphatase (HAD superfamily)
VGLDRADRSAGPRTLIVELHRVIIDSEYALYRLWRDQFHHRGLLLTTEAWAEHRGSVGGALSTATVGGEFADLLARRAGLPDGDCAAVAHQLAAEYRDALAELPMRPGIADWWREAHHAGWRCIVVSRDDEASVRHALRRLGLAPAVDAVIQTPPRRALRAHATLTAVSPEILASLRSGITPAVVASGSPTGIAQARAAGCHVLAVPDKLNAHLLHTEPGTVVVDPELISFPRAVALLAESAAPPRCRARGSAHRSSRVEGALAGLALGDALGKLVGYRCADQLDVETRQVLDALTAGDEPPAVFTGRVTDDTVLTLALADTIIATGHISRDAFQRCLTTINPQGGWQVFKLKASTDQVAIARDGQTNGCVPRSAVLAALHTSDALGDLIYDVLKIATLTHADVSALTVALLFAIAVTHALDGYRPHETVKAMEPLYATVIRAVRGGDDVCAAMKRHLAAASRFGMLDDYIDYLEEDPGIGVAARSSALTGLCLGLTGLPVKQVLPLLLRRQTKGDLDSTAAVYGALAGAFRPDGVPTVWTERIDRYLGRAVADTAADLCHISTGG